MSHKEHHILRIWMDAPYATQKVKWGLDQVSCCGGMPGWEATSGPASHTPPVLRTDRTEVWPTRPCLLGAHKKSQIPWGLLQANLWQDCRWGNEGAQSCSGVSALALWQAQPGWACKAVQDLKPWLRTVMLSRNFKWNQGLVSRRTTLSPPYNHPNVTEKHSLHFQKENFRALVSFIMSWLKSWYSSWNTGKRN